MNSDHLKELGIDWHRMIDAVCDASKALGRGDFHQPIKPYLRFGAAVNRIIAMPAYVGEPFKAAGIKWISSYPRNIDRGIQRAHSVTVLNDFETGKPTTLMNTAVISGIRTAAVSGWIARCWQEIRKPDRVKVGITGMGPIGRLHLAMLDALLGDAAESYKFFDLRPIDLGLLPEVAAPVEVVDSWQACYRDADIFVTCTVSDAPYVDLPPKPGALLLNVSLRDFHYQVMNHVKVMLVDDWDEVCREKTDIETMHLKGGLQRKDTFWMAEVASGKAFDNLGEADTVMFNPMGLAVYDVAVAKIFHDQAVARGIGIDLPD